MSHSILDLFTIGIGPSSSHSIGPMRGAARFVNRLREVGLVELCYRIEVRLFGSLALTGKGHGTDRALLLGLMGKAPETVQPEEIEPEVANVLTSHRLCLAGGPTIDFDEIRDFDFRGHEILPYHPNGMLFLAYNKAGDKLLEYTCYSIGGGFIVDDTRECTDPGAPDATAAPFPYCSANDLLRMAEFHRMSFSEMTLANELCWRSLGELRSRLLGIWHAMQECVVRGCSREGFLPGGLMVRRRAAALHRHLTAAQGTSGNVLTPLDWVNVFALAVSEENASGGRVVTAPTNGAAGIIPAVLHYYDRFVPSSNEDGIVRFLLCAGAIGMLYKRNASISGAEVGCQGEVGVACSMAAGALTEVLGGTPSQVEMAAEIGMEHNLGLTCDPVGGLVQIPCIERCAMAAVKAINASRMALNSDGTHRVSLDRVIQTMRETGLDMMAKYKETSRGGLAIAVPEC